MDSKKINIIVTSTVVAVCIIILLVLEFGFHFFSGFFKNSIGNSAGNIRNYGYAASEGRYMYFISPDDTSTKTRINRCDLDGSNSRIIYETEYNMLSLNVYKDRIYFIGNLTNEEAKAYSQILGKSSDSIDYIDNKIFSVDIDGQDLVTLNDNEFSNDDYQIFVVNDLIYYIGEDYNIYTMNLDGSGKKILSTNKTGFLAISEKYIIFNDYPTSQKVKIANNQSVENPEYVTYIMNLDGTGIRTIDDTRLYSIILIGEYIYYTDADKNICKMRVDGKEKQVLIHTNAYNMNASNNKIYYLNYKDEANKDYTVCIFRCNLDGSNNELVKELQKYSQFLDIVNDNCIYMDSANNEGRIYYYNPGSKSEKILYSINYSSIQDDEDEIEDEDDHDHDFIEEVEE